MRKEGKYQRDHTVRAKQRLSCSCAPRALRLMRELHAGIGRAARKAKREGLRLCVRLNGATDLNWIAVIKSYPEIQFVDYTKSLARALAHTAGKLPANYHVTFSYSGENHSDCERVLAAGGNIAVVFSRAFPATFMGHTVVNGYPVPIQRHFDDHQRGRGPFAERLPRPNGTASIGSWSPTIHELAPNQTGRLRAPFLLPADRAADKVALSRMSGVWFTPDRAAPRPRPAIRN